MGALRQDLFGHKAAIFVDRNRSASDPDLLVIGHPGATHTHSTAAETDVMQAKKVLAVSGRHERAWRDKVVVFRLFNRRRVRIHHPQSLGISFIEITVFTIDAQDVCQFLAWGAEVIDQRRPFGRLVEINVDNIDGFRLK